MSGKPLPVVRSMLRGLVQAALVCCLLLIGVSQGKSSDDLSDEALFELIHGHTIEGYPADQLKSELAGELSDHVVERMLGSEVLRPAIIEIVGYVKRGPLRDKAIMTALSDEANWSGPEAPMKLVHMKAYALAYPALVTELLYEEPSRTDAGMAICLMTPEGRSEIYRVLEKMLRIPQSQRTVENPVAAKLKDEVQAIVSKYGTDQYLRGERESSAQVRPPKGRPMESSASPAERDTIAATGGGAREGQDQAGAGFRWTAAAVAGLLAVAFAVYLARRRG